MIKSNPSVFLDTSIIVSGLRSKNGASGVILLLCQRKYLKAYISDLVVREAVANLREKVSLEAQMEFYKYLENDSLEVVMIGKEKELEEYKSITVMKDVHILTGAKKAGVDYLISLDKKHILISKVRKELHPIQVLSPGDFLKSLKLK